MRSNATKPNFPNHPIQNRNLFDKKRKSKTDQRNFRRINEALLREKKSSCGRKEKKRKGEKNQKACAFERFDS